MSSATASTPGSVPKSMSSRLLTMKFMQRAAASSPTSTPSTPEEPSPKRRKKESDSPSRPKINIDELADQRAVQAALAVEEAKRQAALDRQGAEAGDTRWVLSFEDQKGSIAAPRLAIRVVQAGYAHLDVPQINGRSIEEESGEEKPAMVGRRSFGKFNKVLEKQQDPSYEDTSESESDEEEDEEKDKSEESSSEEEDDPASNLIRASRQEAADRAKAVRKAKKRAEKAQSIELARQRKKKEVNLNGLTSLSGNQPKPREPVKCFNCGGPHMKSKCPDITCFSCGGNHLAKDCTEQKRRFDGPQGGFAKKARTSK